MRQHTDATAGADAVVDQLISLGAREVGNSCLVTVAGEIDMVTTPNLRAFLQQQLDQVGWLCWLRSGKRPGSASSGCGWCAIPAK
jgi:hypothetical protein